MTALVSSLSNNKTEIRLGNFFAFVCKLMIEYQVLAINDAVKAGLRTDLVMLPEFRHWLAKMQMYWSGQISNQEVHACAGRSLFN
ncbi:MAG: hypothetical protein RQM92_02815 [Candidatus Syntrophopropionicum ammoniitolerans]